MEQTDILFLIKKNELGSVELKVPKMPFLTLLNNVRIYNINNKDFTGIWIIDIYFNEENCILNSRMLHSYKHEFGIFYTEEFP